jgi:predicted aspartyl protease
MLIKTNKVNEDTNTKIYDTITNEDGKSDHKVENKNNLTKKQKIEKPKEVIYNFNNTKVRCATASSILIDGENTDCLIDTGAHTSFISDDYFKQRNFQKQKIENYKNWVTANGTPIEVAGQVTLDIQIDSHLFKADFVIAYKLAQEVIIGVDILKPNQCIVDYRNNTLQCGDSVVDTFTLEPKQIKLAHANCAVDIAPFSQELFWVNW